MWLLCAIPIFVILFAVILTSLRTWGFFDRGLTVVVALCTTLLCLIALSQTFAPPNDAEDVAREGRGTGLDFLLVPYAALAVSILVGVLLLFLRRLLGRQSVTGGKQKGLEHKRRLFDPVICDRNRHVDEFVRRSRQSDQLAKSGQRTVTRNAETKLREERLSRETDR